jgi:hypothetical protein
VQRLLKSFGSFLEKTQGLQQIKSRKKCKISYNSPKLLFYISNINKAGKNLDYFDVKHYRFLKLNCKIRKRKKLMWNWIKNKFKKKPICYFPEGEPEWIPMSARDSYTDIVNKAFNEGRIVQGVLNEETGQYEEKK